MSVFPGETDLVLEGVVALDTPGLVCPTALFPLCPGGKFGGRFLGLGGGLGDFAGGGISFPLAALRGAGLPGASLNFVKSCPVITVFTFFGFCAVAAHFCPLFFTHFNNYNNQTFIPSISS